MFDFLSQGKDYVLIESMRGKEQAEEFAKKEGITGGKLTRQQFSKYMEQQMQMWQQRGGGSGGKGGPDGKGGPGGKSGPGGQGRKGRPDPRARVQRQTHNV